jgi:hypothetical protein
MFNNKNSMETKSQSSINGADFGNLRLAKTINANYG